MSTSELWALEFFNNDSLLFLGSVSLAHDPHVSLNGCLFWSNHVRALSHSRGCLIRLLKLDLGMLSIRLQEGSATSFLGKLMNKFMSFESNLLGPPGLPAPYSVTLGCFFLFLKNFLFRIACVLSHSIISDSLQPYGL